MPSLGDAGNGLKNISSAASVCEKFCMYVVGFLLEQFTEKLHHDSSKIVLGAVQMNRAFIFSCFVNCM